jgi:hypothetical protein
MIFAEEQSCDQEAALKVLKKALKYHPIKLLRPTTNIRKTMNIHYHYPLVRLGPTTQTLAVRVAR